MVYCVPYAWYILSIIFKFKVFATFQIKKWNWKKSNIFFWYIVHRFCYLKRSCCSLINPLFHNVKPVAHRLKIQLTLKKMFIKYHFFFGYRFRYFILVDKIFFSNIWWFRILNSVFKFNILEKSFFQLFCILKAFSDEFKNKQQLNNIWKYHDLNNILN